MLARRIEWYVEKNKILPTYSTGFRKDQSTLDCLVRVISYIQLNFEKGVPTVACFLDIENAYNNVSILQVTKILHELRIGKKVCEYIWSFLNERYLKIKNEKGDDILMRRTDRGLAQGDPLSPLIFNIATYKLAQKIEEIHLCQYADDFVLYISNKNLRICETKLQVALNEIVTQLKNIGLDLSAAKSKFCIFGRGRSRREITLKIEENQLTSAHCIKYLGIWLDSHLRWSKHIKEIAEKVSKFLNILKMLAGSGWGVHPKHLRRLYIALLRSRLDYGSFLYDSSAISHLSKLDRIQNQALRIIGGFIKMPLVAEAHR